MKLIEILTENRAEFIAAKSKDKLEQRAQQDTGKPVPVDQIMATLVSFDPSKNQQYLQWLVNNYLKSQFKLEDKFFVHQTLTRFEQVKRRLEKKDINQYSYKSLGDAVDPLFDQVELSDSDELGSDVKVLYNGPLGLLAVPLTEEASCRLGSGTKWCTAARENNMFHYYNSDGSLYIWKDKSGKKYQFHFQAMQLMDARDESLTWSEITQLRTNPVIDKLFKTQEQKIANDPILACTYADKVIKGRWPEAERSIMRSPTQAYVYAAKVIKGRWPEAEPHIASDSESATAYAEYVLKGRWPEAEPYILHNLIDAVQYASEVIRGRWLELEHRILSTTSTNSTIVAYSYAKDVMKERWLEAEPIIMQNSGLWKAYCDRFIPKVKSTLATKKKS